MLHKLTTRGFWIVVQKIGAILKDGFLRWWEHNPFELAAALAYYTIFSLTPLLTIAIAIAALAFGQDAAQKQIVGGLAELIGETSAKAIQEVLRAAATTNKQSGALAATIGAGLLLLGAIAVVAQLQQSLNFIWEVKVRSSSGWRQLIRDRLFSLALVLAIGFLLLVSLVVTYSFVCGHNLL